MVQHLCIICGNEFSTPEAERVICPDCTALVKQPDNQQAPGPGKSGSQVAPHLHPGTGIASEWKVGQSILDLYEVKNELGRGGFGAVYRVHHKSWNIDLAVKRPLKLQPENKPIFVEEAEKWIELGLHPNIVSCYYVRTIDSFPHTFAELARGGSLKDWIEDQGRKLYTGGPSIALERILDIAIQFAWGLDYAHQRGLVHQDVKPGNVLIDLEEEGQISRDKSPQIIAKVTDFGLARARHPAPNIDQSSGRGGLVSTAGGTPAYRSPEQARREQLSIQTDIWSWGLSVLEMFTGERFWQYGEAAAEVLEEFLEDDSRDPDLPTIPPEMADLLQNCFQGRPSQRPTSLSDVAEKIQEIYTALVGTPYRRQLPKAAELRADSLNNKALSMIDLGRDDTAELLFRQALEVDPTHPEATYHLSLRAWRKQEIDDLEVVHRLERVSHTHSDRWPTSYLLGLVHLERGAVDQALEMLEPVNDRVESRDLVETSRQILPGAILLRSMQGHTSGLTSVAVSPDMRSVLSGSYDHTLRLWSVDNGDCLRSLDGHQGWVNSVCFSPDGRFALSGSSDETLRLWDLLSGECLRVFKGHRYDVNCVAISPSGRIALSASSDETIKLWDLQTGECRLTYSGHDRSVTSAVFSPEGQHVLSGSHDTTLHLWDAETGICQRIFEGHEQSVYTLAISPDGRMACSGSGGANPHEYFLRIWDLETGSILQSHRGHEYGVFAVVFSPDSRRILSAGADGKARLWDVWTGVCLRSFEGHEGNVNAVTYFPSGQLVISGGKDTRLLLWRVDGIGRIKAPYCLAMPVSGLRAAESENLFSGQVTRARQSLQKGDYAKALDYARQARSVPGFERSEEMLDLLSELSYHCRKRQLRGLWLGRTFQGHEMSVNTAAFSPDGRLALSGSHDTTIRLWDVTTGACLRKFEDSRFDVKSVAFHPNGRVALSDYDDSVSVWEIATGNRLRTFEKHNLIVFSVAVSPDGRFVLSDSGKDIHLWEFETGKLIRLFEGHTKGVSSVAFSPDGQFALSGSFDHTIRLWDLRTWQPLVCYEGHTAAVRCLTFSLDGKHLLSGSNDHSMRLWQVETGTCLQTFTGHTAEVSAVALSPDGRYAFSGGQDKTFRLWELETGTCLRLVDGLNYRINSLAISMDTCYALSACDDHQLRLWVLDWDLDDYQPAEWDEGARPYLEVFLTLQTPYLAVLPGDKQASRQDITSALTRRGKPTWKEEDFQRLLYTLGCAGYGWLRPEGVSRKLEELAAKRGRND